MDIIVNLYDVLLFPLIPILIFKTCKQKEEISIPLLILSQKKIPLLINFQNIQKGDLIIIPFQSPSPLYPLHSQIYMMFDHFSSNSF